MPRERYARVLLAAVICIGVASCLAGLWVRQDLAVGNIQSAERSMGEELISAYVWFDMESHTLFMPVIKRISVRVAGSDGTVLTEAAGEATVAVLLKPGGFCDGFSAQAFEAKEGFVSPVDFRPTLEDGNVFGVAVNIEGIPSSDEDFIIDSAEVHYAVGPFLKKSTVVIGEEL